MRSGSAVCAIVAGIGAGTDWDVAPRIRLGGTARLELVLRPLAILFLNQFEKTVMSRFDEIVHECDALSDSVCN